MEGLKVNYFRNSIGVYVPEPTGNFETEEAGYPDDEFRQRLDEILDIPSAYWTRIDDQAFLDSHKDSIVKYLQNERILDADQVTLSQILAFGFEHYVDSADEVLITMVSLSDNYGNCRNDLYVVFHDKFLTLFARQKSLTDLLTAK